ncbi:TPA: hypothetical protein KE222_004038 [Escherichia coli]|nr:hypothetical protein [Escherichia coli]
MNISESGQTHVSGDKAVAFIIPSVLSWEQTISVMDVTADAPWLINEDNHEKAE